MDPKRQRFPTPAWCVALLATALSSLAVPVGAAPRTEETEVNLESGKSVVLRFVPDAKHRTYDVKINGVSVGPVSTYRIANFSADTTVDVTFVQEAEMVLPTPASPVSGGTVTSITPTLSIYNPILEGSATYEFQVAADAEFTEIVAGEAGVAQGLTKTAWTVPLPLRDGTRYYWRVRASEDDTTGPWTDAFNFLVNLAGAETTVALQMSGFMLSGSANVFEAPEAKKGVKGLSVETAAGALPYDSIFAAGSVSNAPAATPGVKVLGPVYELNPHGVPFLKSVTVRIPYTDADIAEAGVKRPEELGVVTYNTDTLTWEPVVVASVDSANKQLVCELSHFSLYAVGTDSNGTVVSSGPGGTGSGASAAPSADGGGGGGGGGGCFIGATNPEGGTRTGLGAAAILSALVGVRVLTRGSGSSAR